MDAPDVAGGRVMRVLFVCTGNTCRSPLAEAIARDLAARRGLDAFSFGSAGTSAWDGAPASDGALLVGLERDLDLNGHRARQLTKELIDDADLVLTMGPHHLERVQALGGVGKSELLTSYASGGQRNAAIGDPFGGDLEVYRTTMDELAAEIEHVLARLAPDRTGGPT